MTRQEMLLMSHHETVQAMAANLDIAFAMMQFWITITFGLIVAIHFAGHHLTRFMAALVLALYISVSVFSVIAYAQSAQGGSKWATLGEEFAVQQKVITQGEHETAVFFRTLALAGGGILMVIGAVATVYFGIHERRKAAAEEEES